MDRNANQLIWGTALVLMGVGVFFRIPQVIPKIAKIDFFSSSTSLLLVRISFYLLGFLLLLGGGKKIFDNFGKKNSGSEKDLNRNP